MVDSGCFRSIGGAHVHELLRDYLARFQLKPLQMPKQEEFVLGNCDTELSDSCFLYPVFFGGQHCDYLDIARIRPECPH